MLVQENYRTHPNENHPENWKRVELIRKEFPQAPLVKMDLKEAEQLVLSLHSQEYVENIKNHPYSDFDDNPFFESTYEAALGAVFASVKAMERLDFAAVRPPGHHADRDKFEGFCYFNNIAVAVKNSNKRTAIIDIDAHYGNGTHKIFADSKNVFYSSIHANVAFEYPGYEIKTKNSYLIDVDPGATDDSRYVEFLKDLLKKINEFKPEMLAVSAGFDTYSKDPVLGFAIEKIETYKEIGKMLKEMDLPTFAVLEGGYSQELGTLVKAFYQGLFVK